MQRPSKVDSPIILRFNRTALLLIHARRAANVHDLVNSNTVQPAGTRSVYREHRGLRYHWVEAGDPHGTPLVLVHGFMAHSMAYRRVLDSLSERFRLIVPDLPAHGRDESFRHALVEPEINSLVRWLDGFHDVSLAREKAHWVGHSLGASLAYHLAHQFPERFETMTMVSPGLRIPPSPLTAFALDRLPASIATLGANRLGLSLYQPLNWRGESMTPAEAEDYLRPMRSRARMRFILRLGARLLDGGHPPLAALDVPTQVIWGHHDHILPLEDAYLVEERLDATLHILAESGHSPMEDTPEEFVKHLQEFLR